MQLLGTKVCKKYDLGVHNNLFGGTMLSWIDESAVAYVNEVCHCPTMVTLKIEEVLFKSPVKENNLIKIYGQIDRIGGKSITVSVEARKWGLDARSRLARVRDGPTGVHDVSIVSRAPRAPRATRVARRGCPRSAAGGVEPEAWVGNLGFRGCG